MRIHFNVTRKTRRAKRIEKKNVFYHLWINKCKAPFLSSYSSDWTQNQQLDLTKFGKTDDKISNLMGPHACPQSHKRKCNHCDYIYILYWETCLLNITRVKIKIKIWIDIYIHKKTTKELKHWEKISKHKHRKYCVRRKPSRNDNYCFTKRAAFTNTYL